MWSLWSYINVFIPQPLLLKERAGPSVLWVLGAPRSTGVAQSDTEVKPKSSHKLECTLLLHPLFLVPGSVAPLSRGKGLGFPGLAP